MHWKLLCVSLLLFVCHQQYAAAEPEADVVPPGGVKVKDIPQEEVLAAKEEEAPQEEVEAAKEEAEPVKEEAEPAKEEAEPVKEEAPVEEEAPAKEEAEAVAEEVISEAVDTPAEEKEAPPQEEVTAPSEEAEAAVESQPEEVKEAVEEAETPKEAEAAPAETQAPAEELSEEPAAQGTVEPTGGEAVADTVPADETAQLAESLAKAKLELETVKVDREQDMKMMLDEQNGFLSQIADLKAQLESANVNEDIQKDATAMREKIVTLEASIEEMTTRFGLVNTELRERLEVTEKEAAERVKVIEDQNQGLRSMLESASGEIQAQVEPLKAENADLKAQLEKATETQTASAAVEKQLSDTNSNLVQCQDSLESKQETLNTMTASLTALESENKECQEKKVAPPCEESERVKREEDDDEAVAALKAEKEEAVGGLTSCLKTSQSCDSDLLKAQEEAEQWKIYLAAGGIGLGILLIVKLFMWLCCSDEVTEATLTGNGISSHRVTKAEISDEDREDSPVPAKPTARAPVNKRKGKKSKAHM